MESHHSAMLQSPVDDAMKQPFMSISTDGVAAMTSALGAASSINSHHVDRAATTTTTKTTAALLTTTKSGKVRKKKTRKPKDMPRRPLSAYNIFFREQRGIILEERKKNIDDDSHRVLSGSGKDSNLFSVMAKIIAKRWKEMKPEDASKYQGLAGEDLKRYRKEMEEYQLTLARRHVQSRDAIVTTSQPLEASSSQVSVVDVTMPAATNQSGPYVLNGLTTKNGSKNNGNEAATQDPKKGETDGPVFSGAIEQKQQQQHQIQTLASAAPGSQLAFLQHPNPIGMSQEQYLQHLLQLSRRNIALLQQQQGCHQSMNVDPTMMTMMMGINSSGGRGGGFETTYQSDRQNGGQVPSSYSDAGGGALASSLPSFFPGVCDEGHLGLMSILAQQQQQQQSLMGGETSAVTQMFTQQEQQQQSQDH